MYEHRSGFRQNHSTNTTLTFLTDYIHTEISKGKVVGLFVLDFQKAVDSVNYQILCFKLERLGMNSLWFLSYLTNRRQTVFANGGTSHTQIIICAVPQGNLTCPLLYPCYSNNMKVTLKSQLLLYADDSIILTCI